MAGGDTDAEHHEGMRTSAVVCVTSLQANLVVYGSRKPLRGKDRDAVNIARNCPEIEIWSEDEFKVLFLRSCLLHSSRSVAWSEDGGVANGEDGATLE